MSDSSREPFEVLTDDQCEPYGAIYATLLDADLSIAQALEGERRREEETINLIASENYTSEAVRTAQATVFTNKYAEGYPGRRYYGGCQCVDAVEELAIRRAKQLFGADHVNVQPHSGSQANTAAYMALLDPGDRILAMSLAHGGHLTHGHKLSFSSQLYDFAHYGVRRDTECIDYDALASQAQRVQPKLIVAGASAYPRIIDFARFREIADDVGAYLMVDMAHIAGLVAAGVHPSPIPFADIVTATTHKTLRGPRGGLILCKDELAKAVDRAVFPGTQGGPLMHVIAAKAVAFGEALEPEFDDYQHQIVRNAQTLAEALSEQGLRLVSGGTDNHLVLVDMAPHELTGRKVQNVLESVNIICNKNRIPFDPLPARVTSGIRLGTPAVTTRGFGEQEMVEVADLIVRVIHSPNDPTTLHNVGERALELCHAFPLS
ncbi:MAG: serine hydroxymethyltransferase [Chloroflexota bacterium]|nr:serine hydroxymethyltransferase [Chloroflexota bacterium]